MATVGPITRPDASTTVTFLPVTPTAPPKLLDALSSVTSLPVALTVVVPFTVRAPELVTSPPAVTFRLPAVATVARLIADVSLSVMSPVAFADTAPVKSLAFERSIEPPRPSSVTAPAPAA